MKSLLQRLFLLLNLSISIAVSAQQLHFALLSPRDAEDSFWAPVEDFALHAGKQLDIKFSALYANNSKRNMLKTLVKAIKEDANNHLLQSV